MCAIKDRPIIKISKRHGKLSPTYLRAFRRAKEMGYHSVCDAMTHYLQEACRGVTDTGHILDIDGNTAYRWARALGISWPKKTKKECWINVHDWHPGPGRK